MLITFHSKAAAEVLMRAEDAAPLLRAAGKAVGDDVPAHGVFTVDQLATAIIGLETAVHAHPMPLPDDEAAEQHHDIHVSLRQRAFPLLDMMRKSLAAHTDITWERGRGW
jgi:hypothetical protein